MAKPEIYRDEEGRRRVDRSIGPKPPTKEERTEARITALEKEIASLREELNGFTISGSPFSGSGPKNIKFTMPDPTVTASLDCDATPPTLTVTVEF